MSEFTLLEQLQQLKAMTVRTGVVHEAQALQLRNYPKLLTGIVSAVTHVDIEHKTVTFECVTSKTFKLTKKNQIMCKNISVWVKTILWDQTAVVFTSGKRVLFDSRGQNE